MTAECPVTHSCRCMGQFGPLNKVTHTNFFLWVTLCVWHRLTEEDYSHKLSSEYLAEWWEGFIPVKLGKLSLERRPVDALCPFWSHPFPYSPGVFSGVTLHVGLSQIFMDTGTLICSGSLENSPGHQQKENWVLSLHTHTHTINTTHICCIHIQVCMYIKHFVVAISVVHQIFPVPCLLSICLPGLVSRAKS